MKASNYPDLLKGLLSTELITEIINRTCYKNNNNLEEGYCRLLLQICINIPPSRWNGACSSLNMLQLLNEDLNKKTSYTSLLEIMKKRYKEPDQKPRGCSLKIYSFSCFTTPLHSIAKSNYSTSVQEMENIVDFLHPDLNSKDGNGKTPLSYSIRNKNKEMY